MRYVDGYVLPVPKKNLKAYRAIAAKAGKIWKKCGAVEYFECVGDDLKSKWSTIKFPQTVKCKPNETVIFAFVVYKSRKHRDQVNAKVFKDPYMNPPEDKMKEREKDMPFDMKRMAYGGFKAIVDL